MEVKKAPAVAPPMAGAFSFYKGALMEMAWTQVYIIIAHVYIARTTAEPVAYISAAIFITLAVWAKIYP